MLSRGNYRKELFDEGSAKLSEKTLFEVCRKYEFLHADVIMNNHCQLAVKTAEGNLVEGMRWLQGTFGIRFMCSAKSADMSFSLATRVW